MNKAADNFIRLLIALKLVPLVVFRFQNGIERLDVRVLVRRLRWYTFVNQFKLFTGICKPVDNELWPIVGANDRPIRFVKEPVLHQRFLRDLNQVFGLAGQTMMIGDDRPVEHIDDAEQEEETPFAFDHPYLISVSQR